MEVEIRQYDYDDEELIHLLARHFGSDLHFREHNQHFHRAPTKTFFVALSEGRVVGYCSMRGRGEVCDLSTLPDFRRRGVATKMIENLMSKHLAMTIGTSDETLIRILKKLGWRYHLNRGRYQYFKWEDNSEIYS